jgi:hypothetical protein
VKLFKINNVATISEYAAYFSSKLPNALLVSGFNKFISKYKLCDNYHCNLLSKLNV